MSKECSIIVYFIDDEEKKQEQFIRAKQEDVYEIMEGLMSKGLQLRYRKTMKVYPPQRVCHFKVLGFDFEKEAPLLSKIGFLEDK